MVLYVENHNQSITGGRSLAEIVLSKLREQSFGSAEPLKKVEFPMPSNNHSSTFANREWSLLMDKGVHNSLFNFGKDMMKLDEVEQILSRGSPNVHHITDANMIISYLRGPLLFVFNFYPEISLETYHIRVEEAGGYQGKSAMVEMLCSRLINISREPAIRGAMVVRTPWRCHYRAEVLRYTILLDS